MKKHVLIAYCNTKELSAITEGDMKRLDSIHISFALIDDRGEAYWNSAGTESVLKDIRSKNPDLKIVISIGGWGADGFSQAAATKEGRKKFSASAVRIMEEHGLDGIDIDWDYPGSSQADIASAEEDKENFKALIRELRKQIDACGRGQTLSIAAGALESFLDGTQMDEVQKYLDYVQLMTYDFHGVFTPTTGHHANLYDDGLPIEKLSGDRAVRMFVKAGVPIEKIVLGAAFYGRCWPKAPDINHGLGQVPDAPGVHGCPYHEICRMLETGEGNYSYFWDEVAKAAYLYNGETFISYEDKKALSYKAAYVREQGMKGMMFWEYSEDQTRTLVEHLYTELHKEE